jgi:hypothetical protein
LDLRRRKWREAGEEELHNLYASQNIIRVIKSRRMRWTGWMDGWMDGWMGEMRENFLLESLKGRDHSGDIDVDGGF